MNFLDIDPSTHLSIRWNAFPKLRNRASTKLSAPLLGIERDGCLAPWENLLLCVHTHRSESRPWTALGVPRSLAALVCEHTFPPRLLLTSDQHSSYLFLFPLPPVNTAGKPNLSAQFSSLTWVWATQNSALLSQRVYPSWALCLMVNLLDGWEGRVRG